MEMQIPESIDSNVLITMFVIYVVVEAMKSIGKGFGSTIFLKFKSWSKNWSLSDDIKSAEKRLTLAKIEKQIQDIGSLKDDSGADAITYDDKTFADQRGIASSGEK